MELAHTISNAVERAYRRGDVFIKRRRLMADWATYCASAMSAGCGITPLRQASIVKVKTTIELRPHLRGRQAGNHFFGWSKISNSLS
jgi:hypothetical protein